MVSELFKHRRLGFRVWVVGTESLWLTLSQRSQATAVLRTQVDGIAKHSSDRPRSSPCLNLSAYVLGVVSRLFDFVCPRMEGNTGIPRRVLARQ